MSEFVANIVNVTEIPIGSVLTADVSSGSGVLPISDPDEFNPEGGKLQIGNETHTYTLVGDELHLTGTLAQSYEEGDPVYPLPYAVERWAFVKEPGGEEELQVRVPHALWDRIPLGIRAEGEGEEVECELTIDGVAVISDVIAREPRIDASFTVPHTAPREIITDGEPPASSPTPVVREGIGSLVITWDAISNHDPVTYEVHVSTSSGFTPGPSTLYGEIRGTMLLLREYNDSPLVYGTTYYVKLIAKDEDGAAAPSTQASGSPKKVDGPDLEANSVAAVHLATDDLIANSAIIGLLQGEFGEFNKLAVPGETGQRLELDQDGLRLYSGDDEVSINFDTAGGNAYLRGLVQFGRGSSLLPGNTIELATSSEAGNFQTPQIVQRRGPWGSGTSTGSWNLAAPTQQGTLQVLAVFTFGASVTHSTPAGWSIIATRLSGTRRLTLFVRTSGTPISSLPTFTFSSPVGWKLDFLEIAGVELESADAVATGAGTSATASVGPTASTTQTRELALAFVCYEPGGVVPITPDGWESQGALSLAPALDMGFGTYSRQLTSTGTQSVSIPLGASRNWVAALATFKAAASADPPAAASGALRVYAKEADSAVRPFVRDESGNPKELVAIENGLGTYFGVDNLGAGNSTTPGFTNTLYWVQVRIPVRATLTGICYRVAGTASGNVRSALYDAAGNRVANRTTNSAQSSVGPASIHHVAFDAPYVAEPGVYYMALIFSASDATFQSGVWLVPCDAEVQDSFTTRASIPPPSDSADIAMPRMSTY